MNDINIIQYLPLTHPRATLRLVKNLSAAGVMTILDLEDSAQDPFSKKHTVDLKINARNNFFKIISSNNWDLRSFGVPLYVRVNAIDTEFFKDDIRMLIDAVRSGFPISGIFLPKVESYSHIDEIFSLLIGLNEKSKNTIEIIPMIETKSGMSDLENILDMDRADPKFSKIHYGHFDYCLDAKLWPFPDPQHDSFWNIIKPMIELILRNNKTYIHTPFPFPNNVDLFWASYKYLKNLYPTKNIWACTLNSEISFSTEKKNNPDLIIHTPNLSEIFKIEEAKLIRKNFLAGRANRRSFGIYNNRFIPPHQFFAAEEYLKNNDIS